MAAMDRELVDLARLRQQLVELIIIIGAPRTPSGVRKRATCELGRIALAAIDTAAAMLQARHREGLDDDPV